MGRTIRVLHIADLHCGLDQYGHNPVRRRDSTEAFRWLGLTAVDTQCSYVIISGDLFDTRAIDPLTLHEVVHVLTFLRDDGMTVLAIKGNHELAHRSYEGISWLNYLEKQDLITLLDDPIYGEIFEDENLRVVGLPWVGSQTKQALSSIRQELADITAVRGSTPYTILMLHAGLEGMLNDHSGNVAMSDLEPLYPYVNCVAMGHVHKDYEVKDWIYNPGSPETCSVEETQWPDRGAYLIDINPETHEHTAQLIGRDIPRRPFMVETAHVSACQTPEQLHTVLGATLVKVSGRLSHTEPPVFHLTLIGELKFSHADLNIAAIRKFFEASRLFIAVVINDKTTAINQGVTTINDDVPRQQLDIEVYNQLFQQDARSETQCEQYSALTQSLKNRVLQGASTGEIITEVRAFNAARPKEA